MTSNGQTVVALCPDCEQEISLGPNPKEGDETTCPNCWAYLIVSNLNPPELMWDMADYDDDDWESE